jgi:hypothetical protein
VDETAETIFLEVTSDPALTGFNAVAEVTLLDAQAPGLLADGPYALDKGGADGQRNRREPGWGGGQ